MNVLFNRSSKIILFTYICIKFNYLKKSGSVKTEMSKPILLAQSLYSLGRRAKRSAARRGAARNCSFASDRWATTVRSCVCLSVWWAPIQISRSAAARPRLEISPAAAVAAAGGASARPARAATAPRASERSCKERFVRVSIQETLRTLRLIGNFW